MPMVGLSTWILSKLGFETLEPGDRRLTSAEIDELPTIVAPDADIESQLRLYETYRHLGGTAIAEYESRLSERGAHAGESFA